MSRVLGIGAVIVVVLLAMGFAGANAGSRVTLDLGIATFYRVPVTLVAFGGLFVGMVVMFIAGIHTDLKVRRILRDRLAQESQEEQSRIDRNQRDLFADQEVGTTPEEKRTEQELSSWAPLGRDSEEDSSSGEPRSR